jgi:3-phenylpropionate/trans-cinnamate dioxygenase ferredoxin reductase subunit
MTPTDALGQHVVVVGAGLAGLRTVEGLRLAGHTGPITLVGDESRRPYDRPPLSKQILRGERDVIPLREEYDTLDLNLRLGIAASGLDTDRKTLVLDGGEEVGYDTLVIATGAGPRLLPGFEKHPGVHYLRTADDSLGLRDALAGARHLAVVGGGFIGCEAAASARALGKQVTIIELLPHPLVRVLGEQVAVIVQRLHEDHGVDVRTGVQVERIEGEPAITALVLSDGSCIDADVVLAGLGVAPATGWLAGSGVTVDNGVVCDEFCRTSAPGVYAVGDVARWSHLGTGDLRRVEHWTNAGEMANAVVHDILDEDPQPFRPIPYVWSDQYDLKIQSVGFYAAEDDVTLLKVGPKERTLAIYGRRAALTGAVGFSAAPQVMKLRRLLTEHASVQEAIEAVAPA